MSLVGLLVAACKRKKGLYRRIVSHVDSQPCIYIQKSTHLFESFLSPSNKFVAALRYGHNFVKTATSFLNE